MAATTALHIKCCSKLIMLHACICLTINNLNESKSRRFEVTNASYNEVSITIYQGLEMSRFFYQDQDFFSKTKTTN